MASAVDQSPTLANRGSTAAEASSPDWKDHLPTLVLSAEGPLLEAGIWMNGAWIALESRIANPVEDLAAMTKCVLKEANLHPRDLKQYVYSGGPGSLLGLRCMAMLLHTWKTLNPESAVQSFRFSGMVCAAYLLFEQGHRPPFRILSPWRENLWNCLDIENTQPREASLHVIEDTTTAVPLFILPHRKRWKPPPTSAQLIENFTIRSLFSATCRNILVFTNDVELINGEAQSFIKWRPR